MGGGCAADGRGVGTRVEVLRRQARRRKAPQGGDCPRHNLTIQSCRITNNRTPIRVSLRGVLQFGSVGGCLVGMLEGREKYGEAERRRGASCCRVSRVAHFPFVFAGCASTEGGTWGCHMSRVTKGVLAQGRGGGYNQRKERGASQPPAA